MSNINILVVGESGNGKSALGNTISESNTFAEADSSVPITRENQLHFNINGRPVKIVDTIGLDDTQLSTTQLLQSYSTGCRNLLEGRVDLLFYVVNSRFTPRQITQLQEIQDTIFTSAIKQHTVVVRTRFASFRDVATITTDEQAVRRENPLLNSICQKILYVDNAPPSQDFSNARADSATRLRTYISMASNTPSYSLTINPSPISFAEQEERRRKELEDQRRIQEQQQRELERKRIEDENRRRIELERVERERQESIRRHNEAMERERQAAEAARRQHEVQMAALGGARSTGGAVKNYVIFSPATNMYFKISGNGYFQVSNDVLTMQGTWTLSQQASSFGGGYETVVGNVQDLNIKGNITINSSLTARNISIG